MLGSTKVRFLLCFMLFFKAFTAMASVHAPLSLSEATEELEASLADQPGRLSLYLYAQVLSLYVQKYPAQSVIFENFLIEWNLRIEPRAISESRTQTFMSTKKMLETLLDQDRFAQVNLILKNYFDSQTNVALSLYRDLDAYAPFDNRLLRALKATKHLAASAQGRPVAAHIANSFLHSKNKNVQKEAQEILVQCAQGFKNDSKIEILAIEDFLGGTLLAKIALRLKWWQKSVAYFKSLSKSAKGILTATGISMGGHVAVLANVNESEKKPAPQAQTFAPVLQSHSAPISPGNKPKTEKIVVPEAFAQRVYDLLQGWTGRRQEIAAQLAEIIFIGEMIEYSNQRFKMPERMAQKLIDFQRIDFLRRQLSDRFDKYMKSRNLTKMDSAALAQLRLFMAPIVPIYGKNQQFWLPTILGTRGNCVARAMLFSVMYYPIFLKYKPDNIEFGMQGYADHIEAVLYNTQSKMAVSLIALQPVPRSKMVNILYPEVILASYIARRTQHKVPTLERMTMCVIGEPCKNEISKWKLLYQNATSLDQVELDAQFTIEEDQINPSPFFSNYYASAKWFSNDGALVEDDFRTLMPKSDLKDFFENKDVAPQEEGEKPSPEDPRILDSIVKLVEIQNPANLPITQNENGVFFAIRPQPLEADEEEQDIKNILHEIEKLGERIPILNRIDLNRKSYEVDSPTRTILNRMRNRNPDSEKRSSFQSQPYQGPARDDSIDLRLSKTAPRKPGASRYWKSTADFAKYTAQLSCELVQSNKMQKIASGDRKAFESLSAKEVVSLSNLMALLYQSSISQPFNEQISSILNFVKESVGLCGWAHLSNHLVRFSFEKTKEIFSNPNLNSFVQWMEGLNHLSPPEIQQQLSLGNFSIWLLINGSSNSLLAQLWKSANLSEPPQVDPKIQKAVIEALSKLKIDLIRSVKEKKPIESASSTIGPMTELIPKGMQVRIIRSTRVSEGHQAQAATVQITPMVFSHLLLSEYGWFLFPELMPIVIRPLSQLTTQDIQAMISVERINYDESRPDPLRDLDNLTKFSDFDAKKLNLDESLLPKAKAALSVIIETLNIPVVEHSMVVTPGK